MQESSCVEAIFWRDNKLHLLDQRLLPQRINYRICETADNVAEAIREMVVRGAPAIGVAAAYGVALHAVNWQNSSIEDFRTALQQGIATIAASRPTANNLFWCLQRMQRVLQTQPANNNPVDDPTCLAAKLLQKAHDIFAEDIRTNREIGKSGAKVLGEDYRVLTHCNAGALATAGYGTALGVIRAAVAQGKNISLYVSETRPLLQGARLTVWEMVQEKVPVTLITDNMAGYMMYSGLIDAVIVGADRVAANGDVANKIGTYTLSVLAKRHGIPFYVACPLSTIDTSIASGAEITVEERSPDEVSGILDNNWHQGEIKIRNPAFDITPSGLITAIITEQGIMEKPGQEKIADLFMDSEAKDEPLDTTT